jgi:BirA family transcriptional regulator, biotin operon repressor / biotin---[acetyl-CoA-carboxylase] ligase
VRPQQSWAVLGIGLNVAVRLDELPPELRPERADPSDPNAPLPAASMGLERAALEPTLARLLAALESRLSEEPKATLEAWRSRDALRGREIAWSDGQGRAEGIDGDGRLVVALDGGGHTAIGAGEVHLERIA